MKCLMVGARSNKEMTNFKAWEKTSKLEGFASTLDFFDDENPTSQSVFMSCGEEEEELWFVGEPHMKIDAGPCKSYSEYITAILDSIAYYDEPVLLKMREVPKLILVAEWLKKHDVPISESWMNENIQPKPEVVKDLQQRQRKHPSVRELEPMLKTLVEKPRPTTLPHISFGSSEIHVDRVQVLDDHLIEWKDTRKVKIPWLPEVTVTRKVRASFDDFDRVYERLDPAMPINFFPGIDPVQKAPVVSSWSELSQLVVSCPVVWQPALLGFTKPTEGGGVNMGNVAAKATHKVPPVKEEIKGGSRRPTVVKQEQFRGYPDDNAMGIAARKGKAKQKKAPADIIPKSESGFSVPTASVRAETELYRRNKAVHRSTGCTAMYGTQNSFTGEVAAYTPEGKLEYHARMLYQEEVEETTSTVSSGWTPVPSATGPGQHLALDLSSGQPTVDRGFSLPIASPGDSGFGGSESNFADD